MKKGIIVLFLSLILVTLVACSNNGLIIEGSETLEIGYNEEYEVYLGNEKIAKEDLLWTVSDRNVLVVNEGVLIPLKEGTCDIIAVLKSNGSVVGKKTVDVVDAIIKSVSIKSTEGSVLYLEKDNFLNLEYTINPSDVAVNPIWSSSDESIATVDQDGLVEPVSKGNVTITCQCGKAIGTIDITVKENITEIICSLPNHLVEGQGIELNFNIDDPVITIKDDSNNEYSEMIGNVLFAKKAGTVKFSVKSKSLPSLNKVFEIEVKENAFNSISVLNPIKSKDVNDILEKLSDTQKIGQFALAYTRATDLKEDTDGVYYTDAYSKQLGKVYVNDIWGGREFGNFGISGVNSREPLDSLAYFQSMAKYNSQIGGFVMMSDYTAENITILTKAISNKGQGKLSKEDFYNYHSNYAKELKEFGVNFFFTYGYNSNDDSYDSYSNDLVTNNYYSQILTKAYADNGIMAGFTFYSCGDREKDKNTLIQMVNNNVELIGITENPAKFDGNYTLIQYLRNTLNYKGLIYFDIDFYDYVVTETNYAMIPVEEIKPVDQATLIANALIDAINQGADLFYAPAYINYSSYYEGNNNPLLFEIYDKIIEAYKNKTINNDAVNSALNRMISKKIKYGIIDGENIVPEEISDYSKYNKFSEGLYKTTYDITPEYQALDKNKKTVIFSSTFRQYSSSYSRVDFDFGKNMESTLKSSGFEDVKLNNNLTKSIEDEFASLTSDDQVIILIQNSQYSYNYEDTRVKIDKQTGQPVIDPDTGEVVYEKYTVYKNFMWYDKVYELYNRGVTNITIVVLNDIVIANNMPYIKNRICANYNYTQDFKALTDLVVDGK